MNTCRLSWKSSFNQISCWFLLNDLMVYLHSLPRHKRQFVSSPQGWKLQILNACHNAQRHLEDWKRTDLRYEEASLAQRKKTIEFLGIQDEADDAHYRLRQLMTLLLFLLFSRCQGINPPCSSRSLPYRRKKPKNPIRPFFLSPLARLPVGRATIRSQS